MQSQKSMTLESLSRSSSVLARKWPNRLIWEFAGGIGGGSIRAGRFVLRISPALMSPSRFRMSLVLFAGARSVKPSEGADGHLEDLPLGNPLILRPVGV